MRKGHRAAKSGASLPKETGAGSDGAVQASDGSFSTGAASLRRSGAERKELPSAEGNTPRATDVEKDSDHEMVDESKRLQSSLGREHAVHVRRGQSARPCAATTEEVRR